MADVRFYGIGHSTHPIVSFIGLLAPHGIRVVADVRTVPRSRHVPQFNQPDLDAALRTSGLTYCHLPELGGLRKPRPDSANLGWEHHGFRGFADHMQTKTFEAGLARLIALADTEGAVAFMCAEALPWRCHRRLIADALVARGIDVLQIHSDGHVVPHVLTAFARVGDGKVTYPLSLPSPLTLPSPAREEGEKPPALR